MSYEVLARKWRPRTFPELVGQDHVRRALVNALDSGRLHHAYLFTGTRGVGKTTIARILAKSLNCETNGVTSEPCGTCSACREVDEGRFIDLIEVDAASRTRVDETRELLENVPYAPTRGRYKVYLIDEVHMFSTHSFNALLKTLEEPPPHVRFLLATTDPQKVPVTILSRCLQFNLRLMPVPAIVEHLEMISSAEEVEYETPALAQIARAAAGSMRDALSLLDQAIAFGQGAVRAEEVEAMLGTLSRERLFALLEALIAGDAQALVNEVDELARATADLAPVLTDMLALLHQLALAQAVPESLDESVGDAERVRELAGRITPEDIQLYYQIATIGRRDLGWAPDARTGLEMTLLRMLAFRPASGDEPAPNPGQSAPRAAGRQASTAPEPAAAEPRAGAGGEKATDGTPASAEPPPAGNGELDWERTVAALGLRGLAGELGANTVCQGIEEDRVRLALAPEHAHLGEERYRERLEQALSQYLGRAVRIELARERPAAETPADAGRRRAEEQRAEAERAIAADPVVQALQDRFGAEVEDGSVRPLDPGGSEADH
ncbi:MAG: DNA polymerase III subunit gamma/tau [Gammaproteobacteria bacterium]|nr:DNA polymerase III subunit gamma/tau [Gammaproteobacteria bacterium]